MMTIEVYGSWGPFQVNARTGVVVTPVHERLCIDETEGGTYDGYARIARVNLAEFEAYWGEDPASHSSIDILDLGYWTLDGTYEPPDLRWRLGIITNWVDLPR